jgi:hypothetical protein
MSMAALLKEVTSLEATYENCFNAGVHRCSTYIGTTSKS